MCERKDLDEYLTEAGEAVREIDSESLATAAGICIEAVRAGRTLFFCGNGGSAVDAQHLVGELVGRFRLERQGIRALALSANVAVITAIANDYGFEKIFSRQVETLGREGDVLIVISTSGDSQNVVEAASAAVRLGMKVITLTGRKSTDLARYSDVVFVSPSDVTSHSQEAILIAGHAICSVVEQAVADGGGGTPC